VWWERGGWGRWVAAFPKNDGGETPLLQRIASSHAHPSAFPNSSHPLHSRVWDVQRLFERKVAPLQHIVYQAIKHATHLSPMPQLQANGVWEGRFWCGPLGHSAWNNKHRAQSRGHGAQRARSTGHRPQVKGSTHGELGRVVGGRGEAQLLAAAQEVGACGVGVVKLLGRGHVNTHEVGQP